MKIFFDCMNNNFECTNKSFEYMNKFTYRNGNASTSERLNDQLEPFTLFCGRVSVFVGDIE